MPSARRSLLTQRVIDLLTDEWVDVEDVMERAIPLVPPGRALRTYQQHAKRTDAKREERIAAGGKTIARKPIPTPREQERMGARAMVNDILATARDNKVIDVEFGESRNERRMRLSDERRFAHHCCLHGGSCRGTQEPEPDEDDQGQDEDEVRPDPLAMLIKQVLDSRDKRLAVTPKVREVYPGEIDRLLAQCR